MITAEALAQIFGDEQTKVAGDFERLIEEAMASLDDDLKFYLSDKQ